MAQFNYGKKKTIKEKAGDALRKTFTAAALAGAVAVPGYYEYGTIQSTTVKVTGYDTHSTWDTKTYKEKHQYEIKTNKGSLWDYNSALHAKFTGQTDAIWQAATTDKTYDVKYYGFDFAFLKRNIISFNEVSADELKAREDAAKKQAQAARPAAPQPGQPSNGQPVNGQTGNGQQTVTANGQPVVAAAPVAGLSGRMIVQDLVSADGKSSVQVTVPVEVVGKVTVNSVINIQPVQPAPPRPPGT